MKPAQTPFLKREELPDGTSVLGLFAVRAIRGAEPAVKLVGGKRLDQSFLADLPVAPGMQVGLYSERVTRKMPVKCSGGSATGFDPKRLVSADGDVPGAVTLCFADRSGTQERRTGERHSLPDAAPRGQRERNRDSTEETRLARCWRC